MDQLQGTRLIRVLRYSPNSNEERKKVDGKVEASGNERQTDPPTERQSGEGCVCVEERNKVRKQRMTGWRWTRTGWIRTGSYRSHGIISTRPTRPAAFYGTDPAEIQTMMKPLWGSIDYSSNVSTGANVRGDAWHAPIFLRDHCPASRITTVPRHSRRFSGFGEIWITLPWLKVR